MQTEQERAAEEYKATLSELHSISKVEINALTMLAEDNKEYAVHIAACIENQLKSVPNDKKLPVLYLIDSICKNYPKSIYVQLFTQNIVSNFCNVFSVSDEKVRRNLHKLRMTWNETRIFPTNKLNAIDERVHEMDPNWPVLRKFTSASPQQTKQQPSTKQQQRSQQLPDHNHQQQQRQNQQQQKHQSQSQQIRNNLSSNSATEPNAAKRVNNQSNGRRKRTRTGANRNNQPSEPVLVLPPPQPFIDPSIIQSPLDFPQVHPTTYIDPSITLVPHDQLHQVQTATFLDPNLILAANDPQLQAPPPQLICTPTFNQPHSLSQPPQEPPPPYVSILKSLYGGKQCSNCSLRFDDNNRYSNHLDWHYRQNANPNGKVENMPPRRQWYYPLDLWIEFREIDDDVHQEINNTDSNTNDLLLSINDHEVQTAPASKDDAKNICSVCHETFEKFWAEEEEEWRLKNARLHEDERVYHPLCLKDMLPLSIAEVNTCG